MLRLALLLSLLFTSEAIAQSVTFAKRVATPGETLTQTMTVGMSIKQTGREGAQVIEETERRSDRKQTRQVVTTHTDEGRVTAARVTFLEAVNETNRGAENDPIHGKTYAVRREGENLVITTPGGLTPPLAEYELIARAMATLGKPNPLADFLAGRTIAVGQPLELPKDVAQRALGIDNSFGEVDHFTLTLKRIASGVAQFNAEVEAAGVDGQQMRMLIGGAFALEVASCRIVSADLSGPVAISSTVGGYTIDARGKIRFQIQSRYE